MKRIFTKLFQSLLLILFIFTTATIVTAYVAKIDSSHYLFIDGSGTNMLIISGSRAFPARGAHGLGLAIK